MPMCTASEDFAGIGKGEVIYAPPSEAQQNSARIISEVLGIPLPKEFSAKAYWLYISEHMTESKQRVQQRRSALRAYAADQKRRDERMAKWRAQREADWEATHLDAGVHAQRVLDGGLPPSWVNMSPDAYRRQLRSLGFKSSVEEELEKERERNSGWSGLEGDYW